MVMPNMLKMMKQRIPTEEEVTMPLAVNSLTPDSNDRDIQEAISQSIETCMREGGKTQEQCAGMAYGIARQQTGKELGFGKQR